MKKVSAQKYIRIREKGKTRYRTTHYGVVRSVLSDSIMVLAVNDNEREWIDLKEFPNDEYEIEEASEADVLSLFNIALLHMERKCDSVEFDLREEKRRLKTINERYFEVFGSLK